MLKTKEKGDGGKRIKNYYNKKNIVPSFTLNTLKALFMVDFTVCSEIPSCSEISLCVK